MYIAKMELLKRYDNINDTLKYLRMQTIDSYDYAYNNCPEFSHPSELFDWLKFRTIYKKDPPGRELLQTMQTLFDHNYHNIAGAGDCDCFVITTLACMKVNNWNDCRIYLAGRSKKYPVHIWSGVKHDNKEYHLDLTNPYFNMTRKYPYIQKLNI